MLGRLKGLVRGLANNKENMVHFERDFGLYSGERQTAKQYEDIRVDHRNRYEWADTYLPEKGCGMDIFCGNGYGTWKLAGNRCVIGFDASEEAIIFAQKNFQRGGAVFQHSLYPFDVPVSCFDFVVSLESIEHIEDGLSFFNALAASLKSGGRLIFSVPNEDLLPLKIAGNHFHHKHYSIREVENMMKEADLKLIDWAGQNTYQINDNRIVGELPAKECVLEARTPAQFLIFCSEKL